jgi:hypothetical protein
MKGFGMLKNETPAEGWCTAGALGCELMLDTGKQLGGSGVTPMARPDIKATDHEERNPNRSGKPQNGPSAGNAEAANLGGFPPEGALTGGKDSTREGSDCSSAASTKMPRLAWGTGKQDGARFCGFFNGG